MATICNPQYRGIHYYDIMRCNITVRFFALVAVSVGVTLVACGCCSLSHVHGAKEDPSNLWMAALKTHVNEVYYVGSEGDYSYFRAGKIFCERFKARTSKISLPRTFPFGKEEPYVVTSDMVHLHD